MQTFRFQIFTFATACCEQVQLPTTSLAFMFETNWTPRVCVAVSAFHNLQAYTAGPDMQTTLMCD